MAEDFVACSEAGGVVGLGEEGCLQLWGGRGVSYGGGIGGVREGRGGRDTLRRSRRRERGTVIVEMDKGMW